MTELFTVCPSQWILIYIFMEIYGFEVLLSTCCHNIKTVIENYVWHGSTEFKCHVTLDKRYDFFVALLLLLRKIEFSNERKRISKNFANQGTTKFRWPSTVFPSENKSLLFIKFLDATHRLFNSKMSVKMHTSMRIWRPHEL